MQNVKFALLAAALCVLCPVRLSAQTDENQLEHIDLKLSFIVNRSELDPSYRNNETAINSFISKVDEMASDSLVTFVMAKVIGSASPEGDTDRNFELSKSRASVIRSIVGPHVNIPDIAWNVAWVGADWDGLARMVRESDIKDADKILDIINNTPIWVKKDGVVVGGRKKSLMQLNAGQSWHEMEEKIFPDLRMTTLSLFYTQETPVVEVPVVVEAPAPVVEEPLVVEEVPVVKPKPVLFALKTNLLYDLGTVPTIGIEVPFAKRFSVSAEWSYSWWTNENAAYFWRTYGGDLAFRWWLGNNEPDKALTGHHLGVYGQMFTYDFMLNRNKGVIAPTWKYAAGIEYGYSLPLSDCLHLDFGIGIGHIWGQYSTYRQVYDNVNAKYLYPKLEDKTYPAIFPTKAEISLVWLIK